jgi:hypothetical protein
MYIYIIGTLITDEVLDTGEGKILILCRYYSDIYELNICMYMCVHICTYVCKYVCVYMYVCMYTYRVSKSLCAPDDYNTGRYK